MFTSRLAYLFLAWTIFQALQPLGRAVEADPTDYFFKNTNLIRIAIEIPPAGIQELEQGGREPRPRAAATVTEGGVVYTNVLVQLKGRGTYQTIHARPNLTLRFKKDSETDSFHGLSQLSLNNSSQDPTCLQEKFARELFAAAGLPVARADQAFVTLNGNELGVYVLTEGYDKTFLKRHFKNAGGTLFDGGLFTDIDRPLDVTGGNKTNYAGLAKAWRATMIEDAPARFEALQAAVDLDRFISMIAIETMACHFDGYAMRGTNYRVYHDPESDKLVFLPQGMDRVMGNFRRHLDLPVVPPMVGLVARALLGTEKGRELYIERVRTLFPRVFRGPELIRRVREWDRKLAPWIKETRARWGRNRGNISTVPVPSLGDHEKDVDDLCERIATRATLLAGYLADGPALATVTPVLEFNTNRVGTLTNWAPRGLYLTPEAKWEQVCLEGTNYWHLVTSGSYAALGCRVRVPAGNYAMSAKVKVVPTPAKEALPRIMVRHFFMPFTEEARPVEWERVGCNFRIARGPAPEEIDVLIEIRDPGEVWIQPDSFRIR